MLYTFKDSLGREHAIDLVDLDDKRFRIKPHQQMLTSCTGALLISILMTPFDVVKTRLQMQQNQIVSNRYFVNCANGNFKPQSTHYKGMIDAFVKVSRYEGVTSLWSGLGPTFMLAVPATMCFFVSYESIKLCMKDFYLKHNPGETKQPFSVPLLAGMTARLFSVSVVSPLELIRTKMQSQKLSYNEIGAALKATFATDGVIGLWRGLAPTIYRDVPFSGISWATYEALKAYNDVSVPTPWFCFYNGGISAIIAAVVTVPFDVVKTHKQIEFGKQVLNTEQPVTFLSKVGTLAILRQIYHQNGIKGIFAGSIPRVVRIAPGYAIMITSFEYGKTIFLERNIQQFFDKK